MLKRTVKINIHLIAECETHGVCFLNFRGYCKIFYFYVFKSIDWAYSLRTRREFFWRRRRHFMSSLKKQQQQWQKAVQYFACEKDWDCSWCSCVVSCTSCTVWVARESLKQWKLEKNSMNAGTQNKSGGNILAVVAGYMNKGFYIQEQLCAATEEFLVVVFWWFFVVVGIKTKCKYHPQTPCVQFVTRRVFVVVVKFTFI